MSKSTCIRGNAGKKWYKKFRHKITHVRQYPLVPYSAYVHMCICEIYYRIEEKIPKKTSILEFHHVSKKYVDKIDPQSVNLLKGLKIIFIYKQETKKLRKTFFDI